MAKDDYEVITYRILVYLYGRMKRTIMYEDVTFNAAVRKDVASDSYFNDILRMLQDEGLIDGVSFFKAWGGEYILTSDPMDMRITPAGIRYLKENSTMRRVGESLKDVVDIISKLASILNIL